MPHIFIVDPFPDEAQLYAEFLTMKGCSTTVFGAAEPALDAARRSRPRAIVTRLRARMGAVDGIELTRAIRSDPRTRDVAVVVVTTSPSQADHTAAVEAGCDACIVLPATLDAILEAVGYASERRPAGG